MVLEINGMVFHLSISRCRQTGGWEAAIVDEDFTRDPMRKPVRAASCVLTLIRTYTGLVPERDIIEMIASELVSPPIAA